MMRKFTVFVLFLFAVGSCSFPYSVESKQRDEIVSAVIVAYSIGSVPACPDVCFGSLIARINQDAAPAKYIHLFVGYPQGEFQFRPINRKHVVRLRLNRNRLFAALPLREFIKAISAETGQELPLHLPAWQLVPGAEGEKLPYGTTLPSYLFSGDVSKLLEKL